MPKYTGFDQRSGPAGGPPNSRPSFGFSRPPPPSTPRYVNFELRPKTFFLYV